MSATASAPDVLTALDSALRDAQYSPSPFPHFAMEEVFDGSTAAALLDWLERDATWVPTGRDWYVQHGCKGVADRLSETAAAAVASPEAFRIIRRHMERVFSRKLSAGRFDLTASRMLPGHHIAPHNDRPANDTETHRFIVNLNRGFEDENGGHLILFDREDPEGTAVIMRPLHNSAAAIEFSARSWHCVNEVRAGTRYALLYSFWAEDSVPADGSDGRAGGRR